MSSRLPLAVALCAAVLGLTAAPSFALSPGTFQSGDGNQDNGAAGEPDWQGVAGTTTIDQNDPDDPDTNIGSGNISEPDTWDFGTQNNGSNPPKGNVFDAFAQRDPVDSDLLLYLAFIREDVAQGQPSVSISFELNRLGTSWVNTKGSSVQCREYGDLLVSFDIQPGSGPQALPVLTLRVYRWDPPTTAPNPDDSPASCPHGKYGKWTLLNVGANADSGMNFAGAVTDYLTDPSDPTPPTTPAGTFGEAGLNLSEIAGGAGSPCFSFNSIQMMSRSSDELGQNSNLQDRVGPVPLELDSCGIQVDKTGPATAEHGQQVTFTYSVTNTSTAPLSNIQLSDDKCASIQGPDKGTDPDPITLDPGDVWTYTCTMAVPAHDANENPHVNIATVTGDADGSEPTQTVSDTDDHSLTILHPEVVPPLQEPPAPEQQILQEPEPEPEPEQQVLGEEVEPGSARLAGRSGCQARAFNVRVGGREIERVVFSVDGRRVKTLRRPNSDGKYVLRVNPRRYKAGPHRVKARVTFSAASQTPSRTLRLRFERCIRRAAPQFTG